MRFVATITAATSLGEQRIYDLTDSLIALAHRAAPLAHPIGQVKQERAQLSGALEAIAQSWDECICDGIGEDREIGTVLREQFARVVAPSSTDSAQAAVEEVRSDAARDVLAERRRQVEREGWTPEHDDKHSTGEMAAAAACYALHTEPVGNVGDYLRFWPWDSKWWKPRDKRRNLVKAAALILADIERIDRAAQAATKGDKS
jgi:hypothetical protein